MGRIVRRFWFAALVFVAAILWCQAVTFEPWGIAVPDEVTFKFGPLVAAIVIAATADWLATWLQGWWAKRHVRIA